MLGLILIYFVGKAFYDLAGKHNKKKWSFAILGVVSYYFGTFLGGFIIGICIELWVTSIDDINEYALGLMALPIGILSCWGFHSYLKSKWNKHAMVGNSEMLDGEFLK